MYRREEIYEIANEVKVSLSTVHDTLYKAGLIK